VVAAVVAVMVVWAVRTLAPRGDGDVAGAGPTDRILALRAPDRPLVIVGDGPTRAECQGLVDAAGNAGQVHFAGDRSDTADWLRAFDVFVLPSLGEGISNTILEAMASGLPIVATRVGGTPELIEEGISGLMFTPGDADTLTRILAGYADDPARREREGIAARARIENEFSWHKAAAAYQAIYEKLTCAA
jgi:glycosyltransferase involved in cell wall biosynthesis